MWLHRRRADLPRHRQGDGAVAAAAHGLRRDPGKPAQFRRGTQVTASGRARPAVQLGIARHELFPLLLFIGIGAMIDFGPLLSNPKLMIFGAAAQFGIFFTLCLASLLGFDLNDAASIAIIGAADGPTVHLRGQTSWARSYIGAIMVAAYSYMALVPIVQPPVIRLLTTKEERHDPACRTSAVRVSKTHEASSSPSLITVIAGLVAPAGGGAGRLSDVRQPHPRVRRAEFPVRDGAEGAGQPDHASCWD